MNFGFLKLKSDPDPLQMDRVLNSVGYRWNVSICQNVCSIFHLFDLRCTGNLKFFLYRCSNPCLPTDGKYTYLGCSWACASARLWSMISPASGHRLSRKYPSTFRHRILQVSLGFCFDWILQVSLVFCFDWILQVSVVFCFDWILQVSLGFVLIYFKYFCVASSRKGYTTE